MTPCCIRLLHVLAAGMFAACSGGGAPAPVTPAPSPASPPPAVLTRDTTPPVLSSPIVDLADVVQFIPFGVTLNPSTGQGNPAYELLTRDPEAPVRAATAGIVVAILENPSPQGDVEVHTRPSPTSAYLVVYDHVREPVVRIGSTVIAGTVLGKVGRSVHFGRTELQINRTDPSPEVAVCPESLGTAEFNSAHAAAAARAGGVWGTVPCATPTVIP